MSHENISNIADIVRTQGVNQPDRPSLVIDGRIATFGELNARSNQVAQAPRAVGVGAGDRVAFLGKNAIEWFEFACGVAKLGAVNVTVNWRLAPREMLQIIDDARAEVVMVDPSSSSWGSTATAVQRAALAKVSSGRIVEVHCTG